MAKRFFKRCGCDGDPTCPRCHGTDRVEDREAEAEYADYSRDRDRDDELTGHGRHAEDE